MTRASLVVFEFGIGKVSGVADGPVRMLLELAYDGSFFHGWAAQPGLRTVQGSVEEAISTVVRRPVTLTVAGRTDAGVHALAQVAHFDVSQQELDSLSLRRIQSLIDRHYSLLWRQQAIASNLSRVEATSGSSDIALLSLSQVSSDFDARFSATGRSYEYRIADNETRRDPLARMYTWTVRRDLEVAAMREAAAGLLGENDFLSFCRPREGATTIRTLRRLSIQRDSDSGIINLQFEADAFCHSMVRSLVGALVEVGRGHRQATWTRELIGDPGRHWGIPVAPARGLTLVGVQYPQQERWRQRALEARSRRDQ